MSYVANTDAERQQMLAAVGVESIDALFADVPARVRNPRLDLPPALTEPALLDYLRCLAERNADLLHHPTFLGAGVYNHFIPSVVGYVTGRAEFSTSYTPYQPEVSQGNLQAIYEYQTLVCMLTGLEVANASMYDGATAVAEAAIMAINLTGRGRVVLSPTLHPEYHSTTRSYLAGQAATVETLTFAANYELHGRAPGGYHIVNLLLHMVASLLVLFLSRRLALAAMPDRAPWVALVAGILFAVHPGHVEAIAPIVGRKELLSTVFALG